MTNRHYTFTDRLCLQFDQTMRTLFGKPLTTGRNNPANMAPDATLSDEERKHSQGYMRVNHCGEVCAQALYQGQALTARDQHIRNRMQHAASEEYDHLDWCETRLKELGSHTSYLNPAWYIGSLTLGVIAGIAGDKWNLGFLAETEKQVTAHLHNHLETLPNQDLKSKAIVRQMAIDETQHAEQAMQAGAAQLPSFIKTAMKLMSKVMTNTSYYI